MIYCLRLPSGALAEETVSTSNSECWGKSFWVLCDAVPGFQERYWKEWGKSRRAALRLGYRIVQCELGATEMPGAMNEARRARAHEPDQVTEEAMTTKHVTGLRHALFMLLIAAEREINTRLCSVSTLRAMNQARRQLRLSEEKPKKRAQK